MSEKVYIVKSDWDIVGEDIGSDAFCVCKSKETAMKRFEGEIARIKQEHSAALEVAEIWEGDTYWSATTNDFAYNVNIVEIDLED